MKKSYAYFLWSISLGLLLASPFLYYLDTSNARTFLLLIISLGGFLIYFSLRLEVKALFQLIMLFLLLILPFSQTGLIKILNNNIVSYEFLLFKHEIKYDVNKEMLIFGEGSHHTNYPVSYILSKIFYEVVPNVYINEVLLYPILITICYFLLLIRWIDKGECGLKNIMIAYGVVVLSLGEVNEGRLIWWSYSISFLNLIITLSLFEKFKEKRYFVASFLLLISIIMSQPRLPIYLAIGVAFAYHLTRKQVFMSYFKLTTLCYLFWQIYIAGLKTYLNYREFVPFFLRYIDELIKNIFSPQQIIQRSIIERTVEIPLLDRLLFTISYIAIYVFYPIVLFYLLFKCENIRLRDLAFPYFALTLSLVLQVSSRLVPTEYFARIADVGIYELFPIIIFIFALCFLQKRSSFRVFTQFNKWALLMITIVVLGSLNATSLIYPKSVMDPVTFIEDERITFSNTIQLAKYLNLYWNGQLLDYYSTHYLQLSLKEDIYLSRYVLHGNEWLVMVPGIRTIYSGKASILDCNKEVDVIYNQGSWLLSLVK